MSAAMFHGHPRDVLAQLHELFPLGPFGWPPRPMALGIHKQLLAQLAPLDRADEMAVRRALRYRVSGTRYLHELTAPGAVRVGLEGQEFEVSQLHRQAAADELKRRRRQVRPAPAAPPAPPVAAPAAPPAPKRPILKLKPKITNQGALA
ncbi:ProQ/FINO family protein [Variovorax robiniae]|uniref:ProQ/FINO family protein n=1 Tax=Variovorax robiniae TaxID=1836199 RepID=A0ABU8X719_9BURK